MAEAAKRTGTGTEGTPAQLPEDAVAEILLRLPAKSILRSRAVCKAWRRIATDPRFLAGHARLRPAEVVLYTYMDAPPRQSLWAVDAVDISVDVLPFSSDEAGRRCLIRYPKTGPCLMLASCNGVLLFKKYRGSHLLCNPAMRQCAELPRLAEDLTWLLSEFAFYFHRPSDEYRLLCRWESSTSTSGTWHILSTGAGLPRRLDMHAEPGITDLMVTTPVALQGRLHWPPRQASCETTEMTAFEMLSERFHVMAGPPTATATMVKVFDMDGLLVAADFGKAKHIDLWFLEDRDAGRWECRHRVATPLQSGVNSGRPYDPLHLVCGAAAGDSEGNVLLGNHYCLMVYNVRKKTVRKIDSVATPVNGALVSRHMFRESLVQHPSFHARSSVDLQFFHFW